MKGGEQAFLVKEKAFLMEAGHRIESPAKITDIR